MSGCFWTDVVGAADRCTPAPPVYTIEMEFPPLSHPNNQVTLAITVTDLPPHEPDLYQEYEAGPWYDRNYYYCFEFPNAGKLWYPKPYNINNKEVTAPVSQWETTGIYILDTWYRVNVYRYSQAHGYDGVINPDNLRYFGQADIIVRGPNRHSIPHSFFAGAHTARTQFNLVPGNALGAPLAHSTFGNGTLIFRLPVFTTSALRDASVVNITGATTQTLDVTFPGSGIYVSPLAQWQIACPEAYATADIASTTLNMGIMGRSGC